MRRLREFEAPDGTLVLFERNNLRIINDTGEEALVPFKDGIAFLSHLAQHASSLGLSRRISDWLKRGESSSSPRSALHLLRTSSPPPLSAGDSLFLFENDTLLVLGSQGTEARISLGDLTALLDHLATSLPYPFWVEPGLRKAMPGHRTLSSEIPLLAPTEWLVLRAVREASSPLSSREIASRWPSLSLAMIPALVERLAKRKLLTPDGAGWIAKGYDAPALLGRMLEHWIVSHALDNPEDLRALRAILDERIQRKGISRTAK
jgi:hypothetical protein